jgi:hypothetical protein
VSLGVYARRRFPDVEVSDATGKHVNLLTRHQHGDVVTQSLLIEHLRDFVQQINAIQNAPYWTAQWRYQKLYADIYKMVTSVGDAPDNEAEAEAFQIASIYADLLADFGVGVSDAETRTTAFILHLFNLQRKTQYLCWVRAEPGEVISLTAKHTTDDIRRKPPYRGIGQALKTFWQGFAEPRKERREVIAKWYTEFGLAPMGYEFPAPGHSQIGSYYFTIDAPESTDVTYIDFEHFNNFQNENSETDCSLHSIHIHNSEGIESNHSHRKRLIRAYLRSSSHGHKQIAIGALLNVIFVILVAHSGFNAIASNSVQLWLLATPTILTAFLVEQQRHYYAYATRRQRGILWGYLCLCVAFLVVASFHLVHKNVDSGHWDIPSTVLGILLIVSSVAVFVFYVLLGYSFRLVTTIWTRRRLNGLHTDKNLAKLDRRLVRRRKKLESFGIKSDIIEDTIKREKEDALSSWKCYENTVHRYCSMIISFVVVIAITAGVSTIWWWSFPASASSHISKLPTASEVPCGIVSPIKVELTRRGLTTAPAPRHRANRSAIRNSTPCCTTPTTWVWCATGA